MFPQHGCDLKCDNDQFQCKNGHCIPIRWRCDADPDCMDSSDEENCGSAGIVNEIDIVRRKMCVTEKTNQLKQQSFPVFSAGRHCPLDEFQCNNTLCKPLAWKCDGEDDCGDNSDENPEVCSECSLVHHSQLEEACFYNRAYLLIKPKVTVQNNTKVPCKWVTMRVQGANGAVIAI